jgi:hypothetical protein
MTFVSTGLAKCNLRHWARARLGGFTVPSCKQGLSVFLCICVNLSFINLDGCEKPKLAQQRSQPAPSQQAPTASYATPTADQLYSLVAPIALFPDNLLAQVLAGSTFPDQITTAFHWVQQNSKLQGQQLLEAANQQPWDASVKGLTQFPDVLNQMATNLSWTSALGDAYFNVPQSVMNAVQVMRERSYQAGTLKSTQQQNVTVQNQPPGAAAEPSSSGSPQVTVVQPPPQTIVIQPAQPDVVYVPTYNPTVVYGAPVAAYPGYSTGAMVATSLISFGVGMAVGAAISGGGCCGWGWNSWGCGWHNSTVVYNHNTYISTSNTFVNRNNYYSRNTANINTNNYRANNFNSTPRNANFSTPHFNQKYDQPQYQNSRTNLAQNNRLQPGAGNQSGLNQQNRAGMNPQNRGTLSQNQNRTGNLSQAQRGPARGYGQQPTRSNTSSAFGNYGQGGSVRTNSARGQQSFEGNRASAGGGFGNRGAGQRPQSRQLGGRR